MNEGQNASGLTHYLAQRVQAVRAADLPEDIYTIARHALLDWTVLSMVSWRTPSIQRLYDYLQESEAASGTATVLGSGAQVSQNAAAMLNGMSGHMLDFDDAHLRSRVHPSAPLWPAILAYGEQAQLSGDKLLIAFVVGVEVQSRLAALMGESHYRLGWHNTATLGSFGAAAAVGWLRGLNCAQLSNAFSIVATMAGGLRAVFGTPVKPLQVGRAAANGLFAAGLAQTGFQGSAAILDGDDGFPALYADDASAGNPMQDPDRWCVRDIVFKYHASCYGTQAPIEAALLFGRVRRETVSSVTVYVEPQYLTVCNISDPSTATEAKFSLRHTVALALSGKNTAIHASFEPETIRNPEVATWRTLIEVRSDSSLGRANARVVLTFSSGESRACHYDASQPDIDLDLQQDKLVKKAHSLLLQAEFDDANTSRLVGDLQAVHACADLSQWMGQWRKSLGEMNQGTKNYNQINEIGAKV